MFYIQETLAFRYWLKSSDNESVEITSPPTGLWNNSAWEPTSYATDWSGAG